MSVVCIREGLYLIEGCFLKKMSENSFGTEGNVHNREKSVLEGCP